MVEQPLGASGFDYLEGHRLNLLIITLFRRLNMTDTPNEKLIQLRVAADTKDTADEIFKQQGLTTQSAIKIFLTQVANTGQTPFDNLFTK